jgi:hypothetical protein
VRAENPPLWACTPFPFSVAKTFHQKWNRFAFLTRMFSWGSCNGFLWLPFRRCALGRIVTFSREV